MWIQSIAVQMVPRRTRRQQDREWVSFHDILCEGFVAPEVGYVMLVVLPASLLVSCSAALWQPGRTEDDGFPVHLFTGFWVVNFHLETFTVVVQVMDRLLV